MAAAEISRSSPPTDAELVDRLRKGDELAFEGLYERYFKRIYHFVDKRLDIRADVEETTQEVFISVFASIENYRGEAPFAAWVFGITRRVIAGRFKRKRHPTVSMSDDESDLPSSPLAAFGGEPTPLESYECQERLQQLTQVLEQQLSPEQRLLFELHHLEEQSISEIALALDKSEDSIKSHLYRARKLLLAR